MGTIANGKNVPLTVQTGTVPNMGGALLDWFQPMVFVRVTKTDIGYQVSETAEQLRFQGVIQPLSGKRMMLKPEGQRGWNWQLLHASPSLTLDIDEVVLYLGVQTRIMSRKDYLIYGFVEYEIVQDWEGAGPIVVPTVIDGGDVPFPDYTAILDGGDVPNPDYTDFINGGDTP